MGIVNRRKHNIFNHKVHKKKNGLNNSNIELSQKVVEIL